MLHLEHPHPNPLAHPHHVFDLAHVALGQLGDVHQAVVPHADVHKSAEFGDVAHRALQHHPFLQVLRARHSRSSDGLRHRLFRDFFFGPCLYSLQTHLHPTQGHSRILAHPRQVAASGEGIARLASTLHRHAIVLHYALELSRILLQQLAEGLAQPASAPAHLKQELVLAQPFPGLRQTAVEAQNHAPVRPLLKELDLIRDPLPRYRAPPFREVQQPVLPLAELQLSLRLITEQIALDLDRHLQSCALAQRLHVYVQPALAAILRPLPCRGIDVRPFQAEMIRTHWPAVAHLQGPQQVVVGAAPEEFSFHGLRGPTPAAPQPVKARLAHHRPAHGQHRAQRSLQAGAGQIRLSVHVLDLLADLVHGRRAPQPIAEQRRIGSEVLFGQITSLHQVVQRHASNGLGDGRVAATLLPRPVEHRLQQRVLVSHVHVSVALNPVHALQQVGARADVQRRQQLYMRHPFHILHVATSCESSETGMPTGTGKAMP